VEEAPAEAGNVMRRLHPHWFLTKREKARVTQALQKAEASTSAEIRIRIVHRCKADPMAQAKDTFEKLGMTRSTEKNGVLLFLSVVDRKFILLGDQGIHEKVGEDFWHSVRDIAISHFKNDRFLEGLEASIQLCAEKLAIHWPRAH